jgi:hypothetical protein
LYRLSFVLRQGAAERHANQKNRGKQHSNYAFISWRRSSHGQASPHEELSVRGVIAAVRIPIFKKREWRDRNVEVALATGVLSEFQGQILIALLKDRIAGSATKCHADL